jgi:two-component sensor histidine kinase
MPRNTAVFDPTFRGQGIVRSDDIRHDPRYGKSAPYYGIPPGHLPVHSYLAVPVISRSGEVLGGLFFGHEKVGVFDERCEAVIAAIAAQASIAIDNARLFKSVEAELAERRRFERHQDLLLAELNHRVKNTLAIVLSISTQTMRHSSSAEAFRASFEARIIALAQAYDLLTEANWEGASLRAILEQVLGPFGDGEERYVIAAKSDIKVSPRVAVAMVMAFHELATNAAKYGALSNPTGRINLEWQIEPGEPSRLKIVWHETGGPRVKQSSKRGFGSRLIQGLSQDVAGTVDMRFAADGVVATFEIPLQAGEPDEPNR